MAALYNKDAYDGTRRVLEMNYTDLGRSYQILLGKDGSRVFTDGSLTTTTKLNTPFEVWQSISRGEISGPEALGKRLYTVEGDFSFMMIGTSILLPLLVVLLKLRRIRRLKKLVTRRKIRR